MPIKENPNSFTIPEEVRSQTTEAAMNVASDFYEIASAETARLMEVSGLPETHAASIVSKAMITAAWVLVSNAQRQAGNTPIPERFLTVTRVS